MFSKTLACLTTLALLAGCTGFRTVGETTDVFRCPQPREDHLARTIEANKIRTVVCLRGAGEGAAVTARAAIGADITFRHVPMSATSLPPPATLLALWDVADKAERPLLLHCYAGVDRTGLASAIVVLHDTGDLDAARDELDFVPHGHLGWFRAGAMDEVLDRYEPHAGKLSFPDWVRTVYAPEFAAASG
jgi:protein tyrosine phosphatase (PTP) superfamily phosphohydrolase (DUF442 family)